MEPVEVTTVEIAAATQRSRPPAVETLRKIPSFNHQHSLLVLHNDVKTRSQAQEQQQPSICAALCMCSIYLLILGMVLTNIGCAIWSIVLYYDVKETKCAKLEGILLGFGGLTLSAGGTTSAPPHAIMPNTSNTDRSNDSDDSASTRSLLVSLKRSTRSRFVFIAPSW